MAEINTNLPAFEKEVVYKECRHNHAASLGKVSYDGCCEFLGGGGENNARDDMLCAACNCHRNFHHQITIYSAVPQSQVENVLNKTSSSLAGSHEQAMANGGNNPVPMLEMPRKRRKRTVFTPEQKSKMMRFVDETLGWKPRKADKEEIERFCLEIGISRRVFLVWISNNRRTAMEKSTTPEN